MAAFLNGSQTCFKTSAHHLICKNTIDAIVKEMYQPVEALQLILPHLASLDDAGLLVEAMAHLRAVFILQEGSIFLLLSVLCPMPPFLRHPAAVQEKVSEKNNSS